jgi:hypothetical protein
MCIAASSLDDGNNLNMVLVENITRSCENNAFSLPK